MANNEGVYVFPDAGTGYGNRGIDPGLLALLNNNGGFGGNGNWIWVLFLWMMWGANGNGFGGFGNNGTGFLANQMNNDAGRDLLLQAINGRADALGQIAQMTNSSVETVKSGIAALNTSIATLSGTVGLTGQQIISQVLSGNAVLSQQLCECCCENRLAIVNQTNQLQSQAAANASAAQLQLANHDASVRLQLAQNEAADQLSVCQQTNQLGSQADRNLNTTLGAIAALQTNITKEFCDIRERELQSKINTQGDIITQLRGQLDNDRQTAQLFAALNPLQAKVNEIANKQPNTVPVEWPNLTAVNNTPNVGYPYGGYPYGGYGFGGFGFGNGFGGGIVF